MVSLGIDIGTTTLRAMATRVIVGHSGARTIEILPLKPLCVYTPFSSIRSLDAEKIVLELKLWLEAEEIPTVDIGTVLFTGEAQRAPNCSEVADQLSQNWACLLSAQLNPETESRIAALGSGATQLSALNPGTPVVHIDIGGGTSNFAWIENGEIKDTACLDIGCRKWVLDEETGEILHHTRIGLSLLKQYPEFLKNPGYMDSSTAASFSALFVENLFQQAKGSRSNKLNSFVIEEWKNISEQRELPLLSFSGGIVDCTNEGYTNPFRFGDIGPIFLQVLVEELEKYLQPLRISRQRGKATAMGVSAYGFQVSGISIYAGSEFRERFVNIPIVREEDFFELIEVPVVCAIRMRRLDRVTLSSIQSTATEWGMRLNDKKIGPSTTLVFLFEENVAKTFGYLLKQLQPFSVRYSAPKFCVLDEIKWEETNVQLQTLDLVKEISGERYAIVIKSLRLF